MSMSMPLDAMVSIGCETTKRAEALSAQAPMARAEWSNILMRHSMFCSDKKTSDEKLDKREIVGSSRGGERG